jgi:hypothetical protein
MGSSRPIARPNRKIGLLGDLTFGNVFRVYMHPLGSIAIGAYLLGYVLGDIIGSHPQR